MNRKVTRFLLLSFALLITLTLVFPSARAKLNPPYTSSPTTHVLIGSVTSPTSAYDGDNATTASFRADAANGLEVKTFSTAGAPTTEFIAFVDFKMRFSADAGCSFRILYYVSPSATAVVLQDWTTAAFALNTYMWQTQSETNDGTWNWTDIGNIRFIVEGRADGGVGGAQNFYEYEAWVSVYSYRKPTVWVNPASQTNPASPFSVTIDIATVDDLYGWEFKLYYNKTILTITTVTLGPLLNNTVGTANTWGIIRNQTDNWNATHGLVWAAQTILGDLTGATTDSGTLATLTFTTDGPVGTTPLDLVDTKLLCYESSFTPRLAYMTHDTTDGSVTISAVVPEFPMGFALEVALIVVVIYAWQRKRRKKPQIHSATPIVRA